MNSLDFTEQISENEVAKLKLHIKAIELLTDCAKNNRIAIAEIQRIILVDSLKNCIISPKSPYMLKSAYIRSLFEIYINKVKDSVGSNETIGLIDISDILSREIIP